MNSQEDFELTMRVVSFTETVDIVAILARVAVSLDAGGSAGTVRDLNGHTIGSWTLPVRFGERCEACELPFTDEEWDERHGGAEDYHAACCPDCVES